MVRNVTRKAMKLSSCQLLPCTALAILSALLFAGCTTVPETGRSQLSLVSSAEEMKLGISEFEKTKQSMPISKDAKAAAPAKDAKAAPAKADEKKGAAPAKGGKK